MNGAAKTNSMKLVVEGRSFKSTENIRGRLELAYFPGIDYQSYKLRFRCFTQGEISNSEIFKVGIVRNGRRMMTENKPSKRGIAKVSPMFHLDSRDLDRESNGLIIQPSKPSGVKKKLNRVSFVSKETTGEDENLMSELKFKGTLPMKEILQTALVDEELDLTEGLHTALQISSRDPICIAFEIRLNSKVPPSIDRPLNLSENLNFDHKREDIIQRTVYRRARTLIESKGTLEKDQIEERKAKERLTVSSFIELYRNGMIVDRIEVKIYDELSILAKEEVRIMTGSIQKEVKVFFCCKKQSSINYVFCLNNNKITQTMNNLTFKFKAQFGLLAYFQYLDFKIKEKVEKGHISYSSKTVHGHSMYLAKKTNKDQPKKDNEYFEIVGSIPLADFKVADHYSLISPQLSIRHTLKIFLSNWPYTFTHPVGEASLTLCEWANPQDFLELLPADLSFLNFAHIEPVSLSL